MIRRVPHQIPTQSKPKAMITTAIMKLFQISDTGGIALGALFFVCDKECFQIYSICSTELIPPLSSGLDLNNMIDDDNGSCVTLRGSPLTFTLQTSFTFSGEVMVFITSQKAVCNVTNVEVIVSFASNDQENGKFIEGCSLFSTSSDDILNYCVFVCDVEKHSPSELNSINFLMIDKSSISDVIQICDINVVYLLP